MRPARGIGWAGVLTLVGACSPTVAPPAGPKASPPTAKPAEVVPPTPPTRSTPPTTPEPIPPKAVEPAPPPQPAPPSSVPTPVVVTPPPPQPTTEPDRAKEMAALEQQIGELQAKYDILKAAVPQTGTPVATAEPKKVAYPTEIDGKSLQDWLKETRSPDPAVRETACRVVPGFGPTAREPAIKDMVRLITDEDSGVRMAALGTVGAMLFEEKENQTQVFAALRSLVSKTFNGAPGRFYATKALTAYGTDAGTQANVELLDSIKMDAWWETRKAVATALGVVGGPVYDDPPKKDPATGNLVPKRPASETAQKALRYMMENDKSAAVRLEAVFGLITHGPPAFTTTADYLKAMRPTFDAAAGRLSGQTPEGKKVGKESDDAVRVWLYVLQMMLDDRVIKDTMPKVAEFLQNSSLVVRAQALNALASLGPQAEPVLPQVRDCLTLYKDQPVLMAAVFRVLTAMGKNVAAGVIPDLERFVSEAKDDELKKLATETITALSGKKKAAATP